MSNETVSDTKNYNPTLAMLYQIRTGFWSLPIGTKEYDAFMKHVEQGARIVVKTNAHRKNDKSPHAYLEIIPAAKVREMESVRGKARTDEI
jgi:hypothetical protein